MLKLSFKGKSGEGDTMTRGDDFSFEIKKHLGVLGTYSTGWKKELNLVEWNGNAAKLDIRDWDPGHERMGRGITLHAGEGKALAGMLNKYFAEETVRPSE